MIVAYNDLLWMLAQTKQKESLSPFSCAQYIGELFFYIRLDEHNDSESEDPSSNHSWISLASYEIGSR